MLNVYMGTTEIEIARKNAYQLAADKANLTMSEWVREILDTVADFKEPQQPKEPKGEPKP